MGVVALFILVYVAIYACSWRVSADRSIDFLHILCLRSRDPGKIRIFPRRGFYEAIMVQMNSLIVKVTLTASNLFGLMQNEG